MKPHPHSGGKRTVPAAHFIQVAAPQRWSHGCKHSVAVCWEHMQHERLMQRAENGGRQPWLLAISLRMPPGCAASWRVNGSLKQNGPRSPCPPPDSGPRGGFACDNLVRTNFPWECTVHDCKSLWLLAEHLSYVPVMRQGLGAVPSKYQGRVKAGLSIVGLGSPFQVHLAPLQVLFSGTVGEILLAYGYLQNPQELADPQLWAWRSCHLEMKSPTKAQNPSGSFWLPAFTMLREVCRNGPCCFGFQEGLWVSPLKRPRCSGLVLTGNSLQQFLMWFCNPFYAFVCILHTNIYKAWKLICSSWMLMAAPNVTACSFCRRFFWMQVFPPQMPPLGSRAWSSTPYISSMQNHAIYYGNILWQFFHFELWGSIGSIVPNNKGSGHCMTLDDTCLSLKCGGRPSLKPAETAGWTFRNLWKKGHRHTWTFCWMFEHIQIRFSPIVPVDGNIIANDCTL